MVCEGERFRDTTGSNSKGKAHMAPVLIQQADSRSGREVGWGVREACEKLALGLGVPYRQMVGGAFL